MPSLTKTQIDHARIRLSEQKNAHIKRKMKLLGKQPKLIEYTDEQMTEMIRNGAAKLKDEYADGSSVGYQSVRVCFDYPQTPEMQAAQRAHNAWEEAADAIRAEATRIEQSVLDELIMSPDGKAALERIAAAFA